ncbi:MAG: protein kinase, partial [Acidobacteria bacterium]|nr:protein kinase [Acidobacteriota bacterium]
MHTEVDWARARQIFEAALGLDGEQRESYVIEHCGEDATLLRTVRGLLAADEPASPTEPGLFAQFQAFMEQEQIDAKLGQRIGPYEIERCLGHGGMGTVFYARRVDGQFKQEVAIKFLRPGLGTFERFLQERQVLGQLNHPGIAGILDGGLLNQQPYLVMHFVDGLELTQYLKQNKPTYLQRIQLLRHLCAAVQHAHQNLVVHRDLKPANILVTPEGQPVLLDFGIAKILDPGRHNFSDLETSPHVRLFSRRYASPEQLQGLRITTASDVYQLGQILWLLLLDTDREEGQSVPSAAFKKMAAAQRQDWVPELGMSGREYENKLRTDWDAIFLKATALEPQDRYASAHEFLLELDAVLESRPTQARAHHGSYVFWKWLHRSRHWVGGSMILLGMIGFFVLRLAHEKNEALRQSQRAQREKVRAEETKRFLIEAFQLANPRETKAGSMDLQMFIDKSAGELAGREWDPALRADLALHLGEVYLSLGRPDRAQPLLSEAKAYFEQNRESERLADAQLLLIRCGHMLGRDLEQVRQLAETTLSEWNAEPERYGTRILDLKLELAEILTSVGDYPESLKAYESALVLMDTHRVSGLKRGILFRDMG